MSMCRIVIAKAAYALGLLGLALGPGCASASLIGDTISALVSETSSGQIRLDDSAIVGPGVEFSIPVLRASVDFGDSEFTITVGPFSSDPNDPIAIIDALTWEFTDLDWLGVPGGGIVSVDASPGSPPTTSFGFTPHSVSIGTPTLGVGTVPFVWEFEITADIVPEPATTALLCAGLFAAGCAGNWRRAGVSASRRTFSSA